MKSFFVGLAATLIGVQLGACSGEKEPVQAIEREYVIVVHGGAGAIAGLENDSVKAAQYYAALDSALVIGDAILAEGGEGTEAVKAVIRYFEGNPLFNAGVGATCTIDGAFELDAAIMEGKDLSAGAVAGVKYIKNPINAAYAVKTQTEHVMLAGEGADLFAREKGLEMVEDNQYFATPKTMEWIEKVKKESKKNGRRVCRTHTSAGKRQREMKGIGYVVEQLIKYGEELSYRQNSKAEAIQSAIMSLVFNKLIPEQALSKELRARLNKLDKKEPDLTFKGESLFKISGNKEVNIGGAE